MAFMVTPCPGPQAGSVVPDRMVQGILPGTKGTIRSSTLVCQAKIPPPAGGSGGKKRGADGMMGADRSRSGSEPGPPSSRGGNRMNGVSKDRKAGAAAYGALAGLAAFASVGLVEGMLLRVLYPYWYATPAEWAARILGQSAIYAAAGAVGIAVLALLVRGVSRGGSDAGAREASVRRFSVRAGAFFLVFVPAGYWVKRLYLGALREPGTLLALAGIAALSVLFALVAERALRGRREAAGARRLLAPPIVLLILVAAVAGIGELALGRGRGDRPNILLVTIDTLRSDHLTSYGYGRETSPTFGRVAESGALFLSTVASTPFTQPSTASILTGLYPQSHGVRNHPNLLVDERLTLAEVLAENGYMTAAFSSQGLLVPQWGFGQGFRLFERVGGAAGFDVTILGRVLERLGVRPIDRNWRADAVSNMAVRWLDSGPRAPFFLWLHYLDPHFPYDPPPGYERKFDSGSAAAKLTDLHTPDGHRRLFDLGLSEEQVRRNVDLYDCEIRFTDDQIARVIGKLEERGIARNTIVVITADHGESLGEHGLYFAHTHFLYDPAMLVPL
ncbi:MAG: hypothetical protein EHM19_06980, partial [Candidatus Latescibacterota bacterium]